MNHTLKFEAKISFDPTTKKIEWGSGTPTLTITDKDGSQLYPPSENPPSKNPPSENQPPSNEGDDKSEKEIEGNITKINAAIDDITSKKASIDGANNEEVIKMITDTESLISKTKEMVSQLSDEAKKQPYNEKIEELDNKLAAAKSGVPPPPSDKEDADDKEYADIKAKMETIAVKIEEIDKYDSKDESKKQEVIDKIEVAKQLIAEAKPLVEALKDQDRKEKYNTEILEKEVKLNAAETQWNAVQGGGSRRNSRNQRHKKRARKNTRRQLYY
jgi:hypothetical protein